MIDTLILVAARVLALILVAGICFWIGSWTISRAIRFSRLNQILVEYALYRRAFIEWKKRYGEEEK